MTEEHAGKPQGFYAYDPKGGTAERHHYANVLEYVKAGGVSDDLVAEAMRHGDDTLLSMVDQYRNEQRYRFENIEQVRTKMDSRLLHSNVATKQFINDHNGNHDPILWGQEHDSLMDRLGALEIRPSNNDRLYFFGSIAKLFTWQYDEKTDTYTDELVSAQNPVIGYESSPDGELLYEIAEAGGLDPAGMLLSATFGQGGCGWRLGAGILHRDSSKPPMRFPKIEYVPRGNGPTFNPRTGVLADKDVSLIAHMSYVEVRPVRT